MPGRIAFLAADDALFAAQHLAMVRAGRELGLAVDVIAPGRSERAAIEGAGGHLVPLGAKLDQINPMSAGYAAGQVAAVLKATTPDMVHCIGLGPSLIGGAGCAMAGIDRRVFAIGGLGNLAIRRDLAARVGRRVLRTLLTGVLRSSGTRFVFETDEEAKLFGLEGSDTLIVPGGIDPERLRPMPMPQGPPLRIAVVAPARWSSGLDVAVEAVRLARSRGADVELSLYGSPHPARSGRIEPETLRGWAEQPGITWHGSDDDALDIWAAHHAACLPSRGGEGSPRSLLEAAACGRPIITTDVPGAREIVTDGSEGYVVPPDGSAALAQAFAKLAADPVLLPRMGAAARARVLHGYTERDRTDALKRLYSSMLDGAA
jgi:glycosyltransferase involved in cell wall biosynthesis